MTLFAKSKLCTVEHDARPTYLVPFQRGRVLCGREMEPTVTASGTFWRCATCDVVYTPPNERKQ